MAPPSTPPSDRLVGRVLGRYRLIQRLGSGGMADVYLAERTDWSDGTRTALKILRPEHWNSPALVARFEREASAAARVHHPNVLAASKLELLPDGTRFFATELLVGLDLADTLAMSHALAPRRATRIAIALADALAAAHAIGVVHRDVKPENVFLVHSPDGREIVKLLDFGFAHVSGDARWPSPDARITARFTVVGTPEYMAPEQAHGAHAAPTADVYSAGVVLFEMLAGRIPFVADSFPALAHQHAEAQVPALRSFAPSLSISAELEAITLRALAKDPHHRFATGADLARALRGTAEGTG